MDKFKTIYLILSALERAMDTGLDERELSAKRLGISESRFLALLEMLQEEGLVSGLKIQELAGGMRGYSIDYLRITMKGLRYLEEDERMEEAYRALKGI